MTSRQGVDWKHLQTCFYSLQRLAKFIHAKYVITNTSKFIELVSTPLPVEPMGPLRS